MGKIILKGIKVTANHGCLQGEEKIYRLYEIDLSLSLDLKKAAFSDKLSDTLNYVEVDQLIRQQMQIRSGLIEHLAHRIIKTLKEKFSLIKKVKIKVCKLNPPIEGHIEKMCIKMKG